MEWKADLLLKLEVVKDYEKVQEKIKKKQKIKFNHQDNTKNAAKVDLST